MRTRLPDDAQWREHSDEDKVTRRRTHWRWHSDEGYPTTRKWREHSDEKKQDYPTTRSGATIRERMVPNDAHATRTADLERMVRKTENFVSRTILFLVLCFSRCGGSNRRAKPRP